MSEVNGFRTWKSFADSDEMGLAAVWKKAMVQLGLLQYMAAEQAAEAVTPDFEDASTVFDEACSGKLLPWWPTKFERVLLKVRVTPHGSTTEILGPHPIDPNTKDFGATMFANVLVNLLDGNGEFDGAVQIQVLRATDKAVLGGFRNEAVVVGTKMKKKKGGGSSGDGKDEMMEYLTDQLARKDASMERMFMGAAQNLSGAAALLNATRGVNPAPPWMNGEEGGPFWMALMNAAVKIGGSVLTGSDPKDQIRQLMSEPVHPMLGDPSGRSGAPQLPDHGGRRSDSYGTDQFLDDGQYDGFRVVDEDLLDDGFGDDDRGGRGGDLDDDDDEDDWEDEEEDEDEDERPRRKKKGGRRSGNPLDGLSVEEAGKVVGQWMDGVSDKRKLKEVGAQLAMKVLKP